ncbi:DUF1707 SHOCT-like domain-containing protein [Nocardioides euryhalodurans]|uniref:DUF1707 domain-containing protein n=1 Tax=Nocardioides euryhalodurans TaxID=2518370 RepID=A0A4P7GLY2_9ACTN|nr:DUF1707 domain-containing protein [Nocardioides euryhalodurans]QBR93003.1 DUF1707 domain-containing protein [Nocardioides euryhalodurans]
MSPRQGGWPFDQPADRGAQLRIGDAERERAAAELAEHYAVGRLDQAEHAERLDRIWAARTRAELDPVFVDLPGHAPDPGWAPPRPAGTPRRRRGRPPFPLMVVLVVLAGIAVLTHLPLVLIGLAVWFLVTRGSCGGHRSRPHSARW